MAASEKSCKQEIRCKASSAFQIRCRAASAPFTDYSAPRRVGVPACCSHPHVCSQTELQTSKIFSHQRTIMSKSWGVQCGYWSEFVISTAKSDLAYILVYLCRPGGLYCLAFPVCYSCDHIYILPSKPGWKDLHETESHQKLPLKSANRNTYNRASKFTHMYMCVEPIDMAFLSELRVYFWRRKVPKRM